MEPKANEKPTNKIEREDALLALVRVNDKMVTTFLANKFSELLKGKQIEADLKNAVYAAAAWNGNAKEFEILKNMYIKEKEPDEKIRLLRALALFRNTELINKSLEFALSKEVRDQDRFIIPYTMAISGNPLGHNLLVEWTLSNWQTLKQKYSAGTLMLKRFVATFSIIRDEEGMKLVKAFFSKRSNLREDIEEEVAKTMEIIQANIKFVQTNR